MKNSLLIFLIAIVQVSASVTIHGQNLTLMAEGKTVREVFKQIENETNYRFFYNEEFRDLSKSLSFEMREYEISEVLDIMLANSNVTYRILENDLIVITPLMNNLQQITVTGRVVDALTGEPLPGASIIVRGTTTGTTTGINGEYSLSVPSRDAILVFSFVGYIAREMFVGDNNIINVSLYEDVRLLDEIVVVGYGVQRRSDITGTVASLPQERLEMVPNLNIAQAIQGSMPGIMIQQTSAGAAPSEAIMIRGRNSITADNTPLIIVDGIPYSGVIRDINPNDVQSIEILKDASAAAIYGSRGSNGVILVTTKEGYDGAPRISYDGYYSLQRYANLPDVLDGGQFYDFKMIRLPSAMTQSEIAIYESGEWADWIDLSTRQGASHQHNLSVSGGFGNTKYYIAGNVFDVKGIALNDDYMRLTSRINIDTEVNNWLTIGTRTQFSYDDRSGQSVNFSGYSGAYRMNPLTTPYDSEDNPSIFVWPEYTAEANPLQSILFENINQSYQVLTNNFAVIEFPFIPGLSYRLNSGIRVRFGDTATYRGRNTYDGLAARGRSDTSRSRTNNTIIENILSYSREFGVHNIFATAVYSYEENSSSTHSSSARVFPHDFLTWYSSAEAEVSTPGYSFDETILLSQMIRLNYSYDSRYLLTLTGRRDGFSGFGTDSKWGIFPSIALGWNLSNEEFFPLKDIFNELKPRISYGLNGNQAVGSYQSITRLGSFNTISDRQTVAGYVPSRLGQETLGWESSLTFNIGVDFGILQNRFSGDINFFKTKTRDLLLSRSISGVHGISSIVQNIGQTENTGIELSVNSRNIITSNFRWFTSFNFSHGKNRIVSLYGDLDEFGNEIDDVANSWFIGEPIRVNYDFVWEGTWQLDEADEAAKWGSQPGYVKLRDVNGDGVLDDADRQIIGQQDPTTLWGMTNSFSYRNFSLEIFIHGVHGVTRRNDLMTDHTYADIRKNTIVKNWWTPENPTNEWIANDIQADKMGGIWAHERFYEDASFIRLKDISISYDLPQTLLEGMGVERLRIYLTGRNLFTKTDWRGLDPELSSQTQIPLQKEFVFGLNLGF